MAGTCHGAGEPALGGGHAAQRGVGQDRCDVCGVLAATGRAIGARGFVEVACFPLLQRPERGQEHFHLPEN